jgi:hypothetical protein
VGRPGRKAARKFEVTARGLAEGIEKGLERHLLRLEQSPESQTIEVLPVPLPAVLLFLR